MIPGRRTAKAVWHDGLVTFVHGLDYEPRSKIGKLYMADHCCCDMSGCIDIFEEIDPAVQRINTFAGEAPDTIYQRIDGRWQSFLPPPTSFTGAST